MTKLLVLNGKSYKAAEFDINLICDFEDSGISLEDMDKRMFNMIRKYVAVCANVDDKTAGVLITEHMKNGGTLEEIGDVMSEMMDNSGFFRSEQTEETTSNQPRTRKKKAENN